MVGMDLLGGYLERRDLTTSLPPFGDRVVTAACNLPESVSLLAGFRERHEICVSKPDVEMFAFDDRPQNPAVRSAWSATRYSPAPFATRRVFRG
jgi:hypothetical protein